jgi:tripeptidyl-peptidase-1
LSIGLKSNGIEVIKKRLIQSSDPLSASYGQHITHDEYKQLSTPPQATLNLVTNWLSSHGLSQSEINWSDNKDWVTIKELPLRKAEEMLNTTYSYYQHNDDGEILLRTESYSLPHQLHSHVELVQVCSSSDS